MENRAGSETAFSYLSSEQKERWEHGLRILARMIAAAYIRQVRESEARNSQPNGSSAPGQNPPSKADRGSE